MIIKGESKSKLEKATPMAFERMLKHSKRNEKMWFVFLDPIGEKISIPADHIVQVDVKEKIYYYVEPKEG